MTLHDRMMAEGAFSDALKGAFDAPERFGGAPKKVKKPAKAKPRRTPLTKIVKKAADQTAKLVSRTVLGADVSLHDRVFTEAEKEHWLSTVKRGVQGMKNIGRAASTDPAVRGDRPKFKDNPWANIVHRAATHVDKTKETTKDSGQTTDTPKRSSNYTDQTGNTSKAASAPTRQSAEDAYREHQWWRDTSPGQQAKTHNHNVQTDRQKQNPNTRPGPPRGAPPAQPNRPRTPRQSAQPNRPRR